MLSLEVIYWYTRTFSPGSPGVPSVPLGPSRPWGRNRTISDPLKNQKFQTMQSRPFYSRDLLSLRPLLLCRQDHGNPRKVTTRKFICSVWGPFAIGHFKARRSLCYENQVSFILKLELIIITKVSHLDSLWKRDWGELGNGLLTQHFTNVVNKHIGPCARYACPTHAKSGRCTI